MNRIGIKLFFTLMILQQWNIAVADSQSLFIPSSEAMQKLFSLRGQYVQVVLVDQNQDQRVFHGRVNPKLTREDRIYFHQRVERRPEAETTLIEDYAQQTLEVPIDTKYGREIVKNLSRGMNSSSMRAAGQSINLGTEQYLVQSIERLDLTGPKVVSRLIVKSRTVPKDDPWVGNKSGQKSNREFVYQLNDSKKEYRFRIRWNEHPKSFSISSIEISPPGYFYYSPTKYERGIELLVTLRVTKTGDIDALIVESSNSTTTAIRLEGIMLVPRFLTKHSLLKLNKLNRQASRIYRYLQASSHPRCVSCNAKTETV